LTDHGFGLIVKTRIGSLRENDEKKKKTRENEGGKRRPRRRKGDVVKTVDENANFRPPGDENVSDEAT